jgi:hypothetical protein
MRGNLGRRDPERKVGWRQSGMMPVVRSTTAKLIAVSLALELVLAAQAAAIPPMMGEPIYFPRRISMGLGVADRIVSGSSGVAFPLELTLVPLPVLTTSGGLVFSGAGVDHGYLEAGIFLFVVSVAAGAGFGAYDSTQGRKAGGALHLFVGVPVPLRDPTTAVGRQSGGTWFPYVEPYYRPSWGPWPGTVHEVGLMMRISYALKSL